MSKIPSAENDAWNLAEGSRNGLPTMIRYRPSLAAFCGDSKYPTLLTIEWSYEQEDKTGLPSDEQSNEMRSFEDSLQKTLDPKRVAVLAFVFTHAGNRVWHYYFGNKSELQKGINKALSNQPNLPISLNAEEDPDWSEFRLVLSQCK
jgi:hypothetical protein